MLARAVVIWRPDWGWRVHFRVGSFMWLAKQCWLLAGGLSSSPCRPAQKAACVSSWHGSWFSQRKWSKREQDGSCNVSCELALEVTHVDISALVTQPSPIRGERGTPGGQDHQGHTGGWLPHRDHIGHLCILFLIFTTLLWVGFIVLTPWIRRHPKVGKCLTQEQKAPNDKHGLYKRDSKGTWWRAWIWDAGSDGGSDSSWIAQW